VIKMSIETKILSEDLYTYVPFAANGEYTIDEWEEMYRITMERYMTFEDFKNRSLRRAPTRFLFCICDIDIYIHADRAKDVMKCGHRIYAHTVHIDINDVKKSFVFHTSVYDYEHRKASLKTDDVLYAIGAYVSDALYGMLSCKDFAAELGGDDPCETVKQWRACVDALEYFESAGIDEYTLYDISNEIRDM